MGKRGLSILIALGLGAALWCRPACAQMRKDVAPNSILGRSEELPVIPPDRELMGDATAYEGIKSPWTATGLSLLLPGAGHVYGGSGGRARVFFGAEAVIWGMVLAFDRRAAWKDQDAIRFAVEHAQVDAEGKDDEFLEYLEFYQNRDEFNRAGRIIDPDRDYLPETADTYWQWDSFSNRLIYRDLRNSAEAAERNRTFMFYTAILNRLVSAVDAFRIVRKNNARNRERRGLKLSFKPKVSLSNPGFFVDAKLRF